MAYIRAAPWAALSNLGIWCEPISIKMGNPNWVLLAWEVSSSRVAPAYSPPLATVWNTKPIVIKVSSSLSSAACRRSSATQAVSSLTPAQPQKPSRGLHKYNWLNFPVRHRNTGTLIPQELLQPCWHGGLQVVFPEQISLSPQCGGSPLGQQQWLQSTLSSVAKRPQPDKERLPLIKQMGGRT